MAIWNRLREELNRAGRVAQGALDEGKLRLDLHRARQQTDRFAQRFGYAVHRARQGGSDLTPEEYAAHASNIVAAEADVARYETLIEEAGKRRKQSDLPPGTT